MPCGSKDVLDYLQILKHQATESPALVLVPDLRLLSLFRSMTHERRIRVIGELNEKNPMHGLLLEAFYKIDPSLRPSKMASTTSPSSGEA